MPKDRTYSIKDIILTYITAHQQSHVDFTTYYHNLLTALQKAFGITIITIEGVTTEKRAIYLLFRSALDSFIAIRTPGSTFADASLIEKRLETSEIKNQVQSLLGSIDIIGNN
jgi:hypothetical protein